MEALGSQDILSYYFTCLLCCSPQHFWHRWLISWKTTFQRTREERRWFQDDSRVLPLLCTLYYYISSTSDHQALDPGSSRPQVMLHWVGCVTPNPSSNLLCCILCPGRLMCLDYINRLLCPLVLSWVGSIRDMNVRSRKAGGWGPALMVSAPLGGTIPPQTVITLFLFFNS